MLWLLYRWIQLHCKGQRKPPSFQNALVPFESFVQSKQHDGPGYDGAADVYDVLH